MKIDELDVLILQTFIENGRTELTSCDIAKEIYDCKDKYELIKFTNRIDYRLSKYIKENLIWFKKKDRKKIYSINVNKVIDGDTKISINDREFNMGKAMIILIDNNNYLIQFYDEE